MEISLMDLLGLIVILAFAYYHYKNKNIPPGPRGFPLVGYAPLLGRNPQDTFMELGKKYGNIFSVYLGPQLTIILNDYEAIKAAFVGQADTFAGRADGFVFRHISTGNDGEIHGVVQQEGEVWKTGRRFMLQVFRDLGMGKSKLQDRILEEAVYMTDTFAKHNGQSFDPFRTLFSGVSNVVCTLCYGKRFDYADSDFQEILRDLEITADYLAQAGPMQAYPVLRFLPGPISAVWRSMVATTSRSNRFNREAVREHKQTYSDGDTRDYIDAFLHQQKKEESSAGGPQPAFHDEELIINLRAFFGAGTETTAVTLQWAILFMLHNPIVQTKVQKELDENIGEHQSVTLDDRAKLPYLEAVCREVQRLANVTPFGVLRSNVEETTLLGYRIPKRCFIMPNFLAVNIDPKLWDDPLSFRPERFLSAAGKVSEPPQFMPFSIGKRACVGEALARMEIFLFFANIMHRFHLRPAEDSDLPSTDRYTTGISCRPLPFEIHVEARR